MTYSHQHVRTHPPGNHPHSPSSPSPSPSRYVGPYSRSPHSRFRAPSAPRDPPASGPACTRSRSRAAPCDRWPRRLEQRCRSLRAPGRGALVRSGRGPLRSCASSCARRSLRPTSLRVGWGVCGPRRWCVFRGAALCNGRGLESVDIFSPVEREGFRWVRVRVGRCGLSS